MTSAAGIVGTAQAEDVMTELPTGRAVAIIAATFAILLAAFWLTNFAVPVRF